MDSTLDTPTRPWLLPRSTAPERDRSYLTVQQVGKTYATRNGDVHAVERADFDIDEGDFVSLVGPSGCGKSTLMSMIGGLELPTAGRIAVDGRAVDAPRRDFGYVFQDATLLPWKSVLENVLFPIRTQKRVLADHLPEAERLLKLTGLWEFRDKRPAELSGGMRQRVAICRGLVNDPRLLMMDEPFSALDAITRDDMNLMLARLWDQVHKTAVFITHSIREAVFLSDRVLVMNARPSRIVADIRVPFERPRRAQMQEHPLFNEICAFVREKIHEAHDSRRADAR
ncbi:MAG: ABC transporter ATP-binding protein [Rhodocyclaceae bacterium]|nr:ABC transporter ATP-binding protein [Pseudomonadota bacterium]MDQ7972179.1 ABC transporter ATP-binding protein [Rhodocyclaceae bacterium]MDQ7999052.1 ABC transporter ATP-binding protein [Pseudomonadota bacterium]MDQ8016600.1 ABC transporter ATP-binding protein [Pseudomonadota bacterium]